jgi:energy-coupling factor transport system substrate-specific component
VATVAGAEEKGDSVMWKLREIVVAVILSVVCGVIYWAWDYMYTFVATASPWVQGFVNGMWWIAAGLVPYIVRRPGAALLAELVSASAEMALGGAYGLSTLLSGLLQGAGMEIGFAVFKWKRYDLSTLMLSGALGGLGYFVQWYFQYGGDAYTHWNQFGFLVTTLLSGAILAGVLAKLLGDALYKTGALRNFEIAKQKRANAE